LPEALVRSIRERGLDVEDLVINLLIKSLNLDPKIAVEAHVELALKYLEEGRGLRIRTQSRLARSFIKRPKRSLRPWRYIMGLMTF